MKNKNGFTLIEIIGAVIILGIIAIFAVVTYTNSLKGLEEDYYKETERTLQESGKEFFSNYRNYRPDMVLGSQKVLLKTLINENYISDVKDYNGKECDYDSSYVLIVKEGKNDYTYHTCLVCSSSNYDGTSSNYCDPSWADSNQISYVLESPDTLYIYIGTTRDELKEKLLLGLTVIRKNYTGEELARVDGTGIDGIPQILPSNIDVVDPNTIGTYKVKYEYGTQEPRERDVVVYENDAPDINITYENKVPSGTMTQIASNGGTQVNETGTYPQTGRWAQQIRMILSAESSIGTDIEKFQWNKGGRWTDICTASDNTCTYTYGDDASEGDMYEEVQFRSVDKNGKISKIGDTYLIMIDKTKPQCELKKTGTILVNDTNPWYTSDVKVEFDTTGSKTADQISGVANAVSGIKIKSIDINTATLNRATNTILKEQKTDTSGITYIGYVEDEAGNFGTCITTLRRDTGKPECALTASGTKKDGTDTYLSNVTISFSKHTDSMSDVANYGIGSATGNKTATLSTNTTQTYTGYIVDNAGNQDACNLSVTRDNQLTLTYNSNGGNACSPNTKTINYNSTYGTLCSPTRTGYTANKWWTASSGGIEVKSTDTVSVTNNQTIYAHWTANKYTVTANANGGSIPTTSGWTGTGTTATKQVTYASTYGTLPTPTRTGFDFLGWYTSASGGDKIIASTTVSITAAQTLYAHWKAKEAILLDGSSFNQKLKKLAGQSNATSSTVNSNIKAFKKSTTLSITPTNDNIISIASSAPIYAWFSNGTIYYYCEMSTIYLNQNSSYMFYNMEKLETADISGLNTSKVTNMEAMFMNAGKNATTFNMGDLSNWNVSNVEKMSSMFSSAGYSATTFNIGNLSKWNTSKVTSMFYMFSNAGNNATSFNLSLTKWDTSNVTRMDGMFSSVGSKATTWSIGDLSGWNVSNVTNMCRMFYNSGGSVQKFNIGDLSGWVTSKVTDMSYMFSNAGLNATTWTIGTLTKWDVSNVTTMKGMFNNAGYKATTWNIGDLKDWKTSKVTDMEAMFLFAGNSATTWNIGTLQEWDVTKVTSMINMFWGAGQNATTFKLNLTKWRTPQVTSMYSMFSYAGEKATTWEIGNLKDWNVSNVTDMSYMFMFTGTKAQKWDIGDISKWKTSSLTTIYNMFYFAGENATTWNIGKLDGWDVSKVTNMRGAFLYAGYKATTFTLDLTNWKVGNVTDMGGLFAYAGYSATTWSIGTLTSWDVSKVTDMGNMFAGAGRNAKTFNIGNLSGWKVGNVIYMYSMFAEAGYNATTWTIGTLNNWDVSKVTDMSGMFFAAGFKTTSWSIGNLSGWKVGNVTNMSSMFSDSGYNSTTWSIGTLNNWDTSKVTNMNGMFRQAGYNSTTWNSIGTLKIYATNIFQIFDSCRKAKATLAIYNKPTEFGEAFNNASTMSGSSIVVNYKSAVNNINSIIATKSSNSNVTKGSVIS